jgi:hypothetical protein
LLLLRGKKIEPRWRSWVKKLPRHVIEIAAEAALIADAPEARRQSG